MIQPGLFTALAVQLALATTALALPQAPGATSNLSDSRSRILPIASSDTVVRLTPGDRPTRAEVSRDGGRTWQEFVAPNGRIELRYAAFDPRLDGEPFVTEALRARTDGRLFIMQYVTDVLPEYNAVVDALGVQRFHVAPNQGYVVRMDPAVLPAVRALPFVRWVGALHPAYKLDPSIHADLGQDVGVREYNVVMVDDRADRLALLAAIEAVGGRYQPDSGMGILQVAALDREQLLAVAALDSVLWIDPLTAVETDIDQARIQGGANYVESVAGFDGKGITGMVMEGIRATHTEFAAIAPYRTTPLAYPGGAASTSHGTNTAGEIYGRGANPTYRGVVPFAQMLYCNYNVVYNNNNRKLVTTWGLTNQEMMETASWGYNRTTAYDSRSAEMDDIIFDLGVATTQSQSNANSQQSRPQAWSKNIIAIGGFTHANTANPADDSASGASFGPAADGRMKPDLCAYYDQTGTTSSSSDTSYTNSFGGTSGATPIVNGYVGLAIEMFAEGTFGHDAAPSWQNLFGYRPQFTTVKSLLAATSYVYPETKFGTATQTRNRQGWGFPDAAAMYDNRNRMLVSDEEFALTQGAARSWFVYVPAGTPALRIAMNYADPEAASPFTITRQNSVDLTVSSPNGTVYRGNHGMTPLTSANPSNWTVAGGVANDRDTSEHVFLQNPTPGLWRVNVEAAVVRVDGHVETPAADVDFGVVIHGIGGSRNRDGAVLDLSSAAPGDLQVSVSNVPANAIGGWTFFSLDTDLIAGNGFLFGLEADSLAEASFAMPAANGNAFSFAVAGAGYPNAPFAFPSAIATFLSGRAFDAVAVFFDASGAIVGVSNVDRVVVQ